MENKYLQRIDDLRSLMRSKGWDAVIITGSDPHMSEYPAERWKQVQWLTGFTGEAGDVVVTQDHAGLWTDTRYFIQAVRQLEGTGVELHKTRIPGQVLIPEWLAEHFSAAGTVVIALDGLCVSASWVEDSLMEAFSVTGTDVFINSCPDLLSELWTDRPPVPQTTVFTVDPGEGRREKIQLILSDAARKGCDGVLLSSLDDIAWVLNIRASDIEYNPLAISYLYIGTGECAWFVRKEEEDSGSQAAFDELAEDGIDVLHYDAAEAYLTEAPCRRLLVDEDSINYELYHALTHSAQSMECGKSPVQIRKAVKNAREIDGFRKAHLSDGLAMEKFLYWLEKSLEADRRVSEWDAAVKLGQLRSELDGYTGDSFETISAYGEGAALPHYITPKTDAPLLEAHGLYLCDSGGQFYAGPGRECGTTDITRTIPLGPCTDLEKEDYTLVLKGHIGIEMAVFPEGTAGCQIDALAREPLWRYHRNFGHGTGHGVGWFLGCHEGPQDMRQNFNRQSLLPGMIISDEPGIYRENLHGVRHENLILCVEKETNEFGKWLGFEPLTLCHFDTSAIVPELMNKDELEWLNSYNRMVFETLSPLLPEEVVEWLRKKTREI